MLFFRNNCTNLKNWDITDRLASRKCMGEKEKFEKDWQHSHLSFSYMTWWVEILKMWWGTKVLALDSSAIEFVQLVHRKVALNNLSAVKLKIEQLRKTGKSRGNHGDLFFFSWLSNIVNTQTSSSLLLTSSTIHIPLSLLAHQPTFTISSVAHQYIPLTRPSLYMRMRSATPKPSWQPSHWSLVPLSECDVSVRKTMSRWGLSVHWLPPSCWRSLTSAEPSVSVPTFSGQVAAPTKMVKRCVGVWGVFLYMCQHICRYRYICNFLCQTPEPTAGCHDT